MAEHRHSRIDKGWYLEITNFSGSLEELYRLVKERRRNSLDFILDELIDWFLKTLHELPNFAQKVDFMSDNIIMLVEILIIKSKFLNNSGLEETKRVISRLTKLDPAKLLKLQFEGKEIFKSFQKHNERILAEVPQRSKNNDFKHSFKKKLPNIESLGRALRRILINLQRPRQQIKIKAIHFDISKRMLALRKILNLEGKHYLDTKNLDNELLITDLLSLLELARSGEIIMEQEEDFGCIKVWKRN